jgi:hypothetical protein
MPHAVIAMSSERRTTPERPKHNSIESTASVPSHGPNGEIRNRMEEHDTDLTATAKAGLGMLVTPQGTRRAWEPVCIGRGWKAESMSPCCLPTGNKRVGYECGRRNEIMALECFQYPVAESFDHLLLLCKFA